jgi:uncharacterized membrane protein
MVNLNRTMYYLLVIGSLASSALYVLGLAFFVLQNPSPSANLPNFNPATFFTDLLALRPIAVLALATIVLIGTPIARVFISILVFAKNGEMRFVLVTAVVFVVLMVGLLVGYFFHISPS